MPPIDQPLCTRRLTLRWHDPDDADALRSDMQMLTSGSAL